MHPLIINLAPTGMVPTRLDSPHVPLTPAEIAADVARCVAAGVSMVHIHARNPDGTPSEDPDIFADIIYRIRCQTPEVVIITTTSGRLIQDVRKRGSTLFLQDDVKPDMASLTLASMNFARVASVNAPDTIMQLARWMQEHDIRPELEVFDLGMINYAKILADKGLIKPPFYFNLLLGNPASAQVNLLHLATLINDLPAESYWSLAGIGRFQAKANALGVVLGNGVRVGLEDNLWLDDERTQFASNLQLVERIVKHAQALNRPIATCQQVRQQLALTPRG